MKSPTSVGSTLNVGHRHCLVAIQPVHPKWIGGRADNQGSNQL